MKTTITTILTLLFTLNLFAATELPKDAAALKGKRGTLTLKYDGQVRQNESGGPCDISEGPYSELSIQLNSQAYHNPIFSFELEQDEKLSRSTKGDTVTYTITHGDAVNQAAKALCGRLVRKVTGIKSILTITKNSATFERTYNCGVLGGGKTTETYTCKF